MRNASTAPADAHAAGDDAPREKPPRPGTAAAGIPEQVALLGCLRESKTCEFLDVSPTTLGRIERDDPSFPAAYRIGPRLKVRRIADLVAWRDAQLASVLPPERHKGRPPVPKKKPKEPESEPASKAKSKAKGMAA